MRNLWPSCSYWTPISILPMIRDDRCPSPVPSGGPMPTILTLSFLTGYVIGHACWVWWELKSISFWRSRSFPASVLHTKQLSKPLSYDPRCNVIQCKSSGGYACMNQVWTTEITKELNSRKYFPLSTWDFISLGILNLTLLFLFIW